MRLIGNSLWCIFGGGIIAILGGLVGLIYYGTTPNTGKNYEIIRRH